MLKDRLSRNLDVKLTNLKRKYKIPIVLLISYLF